MPKLEFRLGFAKMMKSSQNNTNEHPSIQMYLSDKSYQLHCTN